MICTPPHSPPTLHRNRRTDLKRLALTPRAQTGALLFTLLSALVGLAVVTALLIGLAAAWWYPLLPSLDKVTRYQPQQALQVFTADEVEIAQFGAEHRQFLPIAQVPKLMQDAVVAVEDHRFRQHHGIDLVGIARAIVANLMGRREGASTITQQVARTFFLSNRKTAERKIKEAMLALKMERSLGKDQILELYLNQIYLGHRAYGFGAAAQVYFGKPLADLSVAEAAMLAGLPQNPAFANPITNFERATRRQLIVLARMHELDLITDAQWDAAKAEKLNVRALRQTPLHAEYVAEMARQVVVERFGDQAYSQGYKVYTSVLARDQQAAYQAVRRGVLAYDRRQPYRGPEGLEDLPTAAAEEDQAASLALKDYSDDDELRVAIVLRASPHEVVARLASGDTVHLSGEGLRWAQAALNPKAAGDLAIRRGAILRVLRQDTPPPTRSGPLALGSPATSATWVITQWPDVQSALVSLTPNTGRIRALVGGFDFADQQFNHVTTGWRQPGSTFKPFLYSAALEKGLTPASLINDAPLSFSGGEGTLGWSPKNDDGVYDGPITLRQALAKSKNLVSVRLVKFLGVQTAREWAARFGFDVDKQPDNLTLALGSGSVTPLQLASAYAVFANGGYRVAPVLIERITDSQGKLLFEAPPPANLAEIDRAVPAGNAFLTDSLLQEVTRSGTAARAQQVLQRPDIFGKTGTTNDSVDAWFVGFQPSLAAVVWMGYDKPRSLGSREFGSTLSLPIWLDYMGHVLKGVPQTIYTPPEGVARIDDDWRYLQPPEGGFVSRLDLDADSQTPVTIPP